MNIDLDRITKARFIKLGRGAESVEQRCIAAGMGSIGFWSSIDEFNLLAISGSWDEYKEKVLDDIQSNPAWDHKSLRAKRQHATSATNQVKEFFTSGEETLWITFHDLHLYFGTFSGDFLPGIDGSLGGCARQLSHGWSNKDIHGNPLFIDRLSGNLTKVRMNRGTSCGLNDSQLGYLKRRLAGVVPEFVREIDDSREQMVNAVSNALAELQPKDFEVLVEILFSRVWRRVGKAGGGLRFVDITFEDPMNPDRIIGVQVKSETSKRQLFDYLDRKDIDRYDHFYFVYHTLSGELDADEIDESVVTLIGRMQLANLVVDSGLTHWLKEKVS